MTKNPAFTCVCRIFVVPLQPILRFCAQIKLTKTTN